MNLRNFRGEKFRLKDGIVVSEKINGKWVRQTSPMHKVNGWSTAAYTDHMRPCEFRLMARDQGFTFG